MTRIGRKRKQKGNRACGIGAMCAFAALLAVLLISLLAQTDEKTTVYPPDHNVIKETPPAPGAIFHDLTAEQTGINRVTLRFTPDAPKTEYWYAYQYIGNDYYHYETCTEPSAVIGDLIPGGRYEFFISDTREGLDAPDAPSTALALQAAGAYVSRGYSLGDAGMCFTIAGESPVDEAACRAFRSAPASEFARCASLSDCHLTLSVNLSAGAAAETLRCLTVLETPGKQSYVAVCDWNISKKAYRNYRYCLLIDSLLHDAQTQEGALETGAYKLTMYINGQYAAQTVFEITAEDAR